LTHGGFGYGLRNDGGVTFLNFAVAFDLTIVHSLFKKKVDHLVTFRSGNTKMQIEFFLTRAGTRGLCKDCKVIPDRPQVYGCCSVDQMSSHRDYRELLGYYLSTFARRIKNLRFKLKL